MTIKNIHDFHEYVVRFIENDKPKPALAALRALIIVFLVFDFAAGFWFTVLPLATMAAHNFYSHIIAPIDAWLDAEPITGQALRITTAWSLLAGFAWLARERLNY